MTAVVHVVDDDESFRTAVGRRLRMAGYQVVTYENASQLLERLPGENGPACIVLDVRIPGMSGPELQERLAELGSNLPIIFLTGHADVPVTVRAIKAGAEDFLIKPVAGDRLIEAIERAVAQQQMRQRQFEVTDAWRALADTLTARERAVFQLVVHGRQNKQIAFELDITERTVKAHRQSVMEKLKVHSLLELAFVAERLGILSRADRDRMLERSGWEEPSKAAQKD
jgi:RNA polymerase sigma factor (sigma-70 family)